MPCRFYFQLTLYSYNQSYIKDGWWDCLQKILSSVTSGFSTDYTPSLCGHVPWAYEYAPFMPDTRGNDYNMGTSLLLLCASCPIIHH